VLSVAFVGLAIKDAKIRQVCIETLACAYNFLETQKAQQFTKGFSQKVD